jgi:glycosyltransferase involved in cell wall biosynthesis
MLSQNLLKKVLYKFNLFIEKLVFKNIDFFYLGDVNSVPYIKEVYPQCTGEPNVISVDARLFYPVSKVDAKQKLGWDISKKYILYVGRLDKVKHTDELIYLWIEIKKEMPEVELVFIGGIETEPFFNLAKENNVMMYPRTMNVDLPIYYSAADVYVLLGLENIKFGGLGVAPTESLSCGTPVVSSNLRNIVGGSLHGIGEAPQTLEGHKEAIIKVLKSPENYTKCRDIIIKHYTEEAIAKRADQVIKQLSSKYSHLS